MNTPVPTTAGAVFLSYASQDVEAARRICDALRAAGVEVWFDQNELVGGDQWDTKIKRQIRECALFVPIVSANTQARTEGYFRREWNLAAQRLLDMAPGRPFLLPIAIDDTREQDAFVAEEFLKVQWMRLPGGEASPAQIGRVRALLQTLSQGTTHPLSRRAPPTVLPSASRWKRGPRLWLAAVVMLVAAVGVAIYQGRGPAPGVTKQLAILPFTTIGDAPANHAFSDGLSETISSQLTQLEQFQRKLLVVPMAEVRKEAVVTPSQARAMFGATLVLTGSVQRDETLVRVTVSLVDAVSLRIVRSGTFNNPPTELYRLQDRIAAQTAEWLGLDLSPEAKRALAAGQTNVASAYELYVQGRGELARRDSSGSVDAAIVRLQQATMADPQYALAHAALGEAFWRKYLETKDRQWVADAQRSCRAAMQYGATLPTPHITLATLLIGLGEYEQAVAEAEAALRLDSTSAEATRALARAYDRLNRQGEAEAAFKRAIARSPDNPQVHTELGVFYWRSGRLADAEISFRRVIGLTPSSYSAYRNLGGLLVMMGKTEPAAELLEKSLALKPTPGAYSNLGTLRFQQGRYADAATLYDSAVALSPKDHVLLGNLGDALRNAPGRDHDAVQAYARAILLADAALAVNPKDAGVRAVLARYHAMTGNKERAVVEIEQARALGSNNVPVMYIAALVYEKTGDRSRAAEALEAALKGGYSRTDVIQEPILKELRGEPKIASLLAEPPRQSK